MAPFARLLTAALWLAPALAQAEADDPSRSNVKVWAAVAYINHGEKTPSASDGDSTLTPAGAHQMLLQGQVFRARYLNGSSSTNSSDEDALQTALIQDIGKDGIVNSQLAISAQSNQWTTASAMAFLQGLYPAAEKQFPSIIGGPDISNDWIADTEEEYPLDGYQYPMVLTAGSTDPNSAVMEGTLGCSNWQNQMETNLTTRAELVETAKTSQNFYEKLLSTAPLQGFIPAKDANFWNAYEIYELVSYLYRHNETVFKNLANANQTHATLYRYAAQMERAKTSGPVAATNDPLNVLYSVAGRTLGLSMLNQLKRSILTKAERGKLSLMFGSFRPIASLSSVLELPDRRNAASSPLSVLPEPGAAVVAELISNDMYGIIPEESELQVRFYYYPDAGSQETPTLIRAYGSGLGGASIPYSSFKTRMQSEGLTPSQWCNVCKATSASSPWCALESDDADNANHGSSSGGKSGLSPAVGGVIGAVVTLAVAGLVFAILFGLFGFRFQRSGRQSRTGSFGGFKGPEKRASDADVDTSKGGAAPRIGSWEMRDDGAAPGGLATTNDFSRHGQRADEDGISVLDATPVRAHESV
jgi:hypothetical protein